MNIDLYLLPPVVSVIVEGGMINCGLSLGVLENILKVVICMTAYGSIGETVLVGSLLVNDVFVEQF